MNLLKSKHEVAELTTVQLRKYIEILEDRVIYLDNDRNKWQAQAQGLVSVRTMFRRQSKRFGKFQTRFAKNQRELYKLKREAQTFKLSPPPKAKKTRLNKHRKRALLRKTTPVASPISTATFQSSPLSEWSSPSTYYGSPVYYNTPQNYPNNNTPSPLPLYDAVGQNVDSELYDNSFEAFYMATHVVDLDE